jgi:hypothetical protein
LQAKRSKKRYDVNQNHKTRRAFARFTIALTLGDIGRSNKVRGETSAGQTGTINGSRDCEAQDNQAARLPAIQCSRTGRRTPAVLLVAIALQSGLVPGSEIGSAASVAANPAGKLAEPARANDRLSPAAFADPPIQNRPGCFWAWLNGSITAEQITRDLEAMKQGGMRGGEI